MKGMCSKKLRGLQDAGFLYISLKRSLPPIFDIYLQFLPTKKDTIRALLDLRIVFKGIYQQSHVTNFVQVSHLKNDKQKGFYTLREKVQGKFELRL